MRYKHYSKEEIKAINYLLQNKKEIKARLEDREGAHSVTACLTLPRGLDQVKGRAIWVGSFGPYFLLCAELDSGEVQHWILSQDLKPLAHVQTWLDWDPPKGELE